MADKQISELPEVPVVTDDTLIPVYVPGSTDPAQRMTGKQFADFARESASADVQRAVDAADNAEAAKNGAEAAQAAAEAARDSIIVDQDKLAKAVAQAKENADNASGSAGAAANSAQLSESWAVGGTGTRDGEDTDNAEFWANKAQAEADRATIPPVAGVYNVILSDRVTGSRYALIVEGGRLELLGVADTLDATDFTLIDPATGTGWILAVDNGKLLIEEV